MKRSWKTILFLAIWTALLGAVYRGFSGTPYTVFVAAVYAVAATVFFVFFLLVNGGWRSLPAEEKKAAEKKGAAPLPRADLFHLGTEKQEKAARLLLMLSAPFFFILMADYIYLHFFFKG